MRIHPLMAASLSIAALLISTCSSQPNARVDIIQDTFPETQAHIKSILLEIYDDAMTADTAGLTAIHLNSVKFSKFGPRSFERQTVEQTNASESAFFTSISDLQLELKDIKVDVFGEVAIATFYPHYTFVRDGQTVEGLTRQTLVFVNTAQGWKIVHEHGTTRK